MAPGWGDYHCLGVVLEGRIAVQCLLLTPPFSPPLTPAFRPQYLCPHSFACSLESPFRQPCLFPPPAADPLTTTLTACFWNARCSSSGCLAPLRPAGIHPAFAPSTPAPHKSTSPLDPGFHHPPTHPAFLQLDKLGLKVSLF